MYYTSFDPNKGDRLVAAGIHLSNLKEEALAISAVPHSDEPSIARAVKLAELADKAMSDLKPVVVEENRSFYDTCRAIHKTIARDGTYDTLDPMIGKPTYTPMLVDVRVLIQRIGKEAIDISRANEPTSEAAHIANLTRRLISLCVAYNIDILNG